MVMSEQLGSTETHQGSLGNMSLCMRAFIPPIGFTGFFSNVDDTFIAAVVATALRGRITRADVSASASVSLFDDVIVAITARHFASPSFVIVIFLFGFAPSNLAVFHSLGPLNYLVIGFFSLNRRNDDGGSRRLLDDNLLRLLTNDDGRRRGFRTEVFGRFGVSF
jgi:hypothetical protein